MSHVDPEKPQANLPLISCICPTYGRPPHHQHLLEEAIESFLRQTYPNKELIVLNDCQQQELICHAPGVRVVNIPARFRTLGEKYNAAIALANGELIAPWEDDDISLPWRLALSVERLGDAGYFNPRRYWYLDGIGLHGDHQMGYGHNLSLFTRDAFVAVGGYPASSGPQDAQMDDALCSQGPWVGAQLAHLGKRAVRNNRPDEKKLKKKEWFYIYRWGVSPAHLSGNVAPESFYKEFGARPVEPGQFILHPQWHTDYVAETRRALSKKKRKRSA